jgi:hypothetical protein
MNSARAMTGLALLLCTRGPWVSFNGMVVFHVAIVPIVVTLYAGFGAYITFSCLAPLNSNGQDGEKHDCRKWQELLHHTDCLSLKFSINA